MDKKIDNRVILFLICIQPVLDILTSFNSYYRIFPISIGAIARPLIMFSIFTFLLYLYWKRNKKAILIFFLPFVSILLMLTVNFLWKSNFILFAEINFAIRTSYFIVMFYFVIYHFKDNLLDSRTLLQSVKIVSIIIGACYWIAIATGTSLDSYQYNNIGYSGWFYAANELGVIIIILLGLSIIQLNKDKSITSWLAFLLLLSMVPMLGTKTSFLGGILIIGFYTVYLLWKNKFQFWRNLYTIAYIFTIIIFIGFIQLSPIASNNPEIRMTEVQQKKDIIQTNHPADSTLTSRILSSRDIYFKDIKEDFSESEPVRKTFGMGYAGDYGKFPKIIEMDFFDLFFSYGWIGTMLILIPIVYLAYLCIRRLIPLTFEHTLLLYVLGLCLGISFIAGHVLFAPSVVTYLTILLLLLGNKGLYNKGASLNE